MKRSNIVIVDEAALIPKTIYDEVIEPTLEPYKFKGLELLPKQIFLTSARTKDNWMWRHLKGTVYEHYRGNKRQDDYKYGFFAGDAYTAVMNGIMKPATLRDRRKKTDDFAFQTEYMNIWLGEGKDAIFKYSDFHEAQIWEDAFIPTSSMDYISGRKREIKKNPNEIRVMGVDIAIVGGKNNDNTAITLGVINTETGIRRIEYIWAKSGMNSILQIMMIKRLYYDYECDYMIYDTQGVGNVFYDLMTDTTEDPEFGRTRENGNPYKAWNINQDKKLQLCSDAVISDKINKAMQEGERVMSEQILQRGNAVERSRTRTIAQVAMLGAVAGVLMNLEFPIPFLAPSFYQLDFSEVPVMVGTFAMGPVAGILIELVKILVHLVTKGTMTAGVGDVANFLFGCAYVVPAGLIYRFRHKKSRVHAVAGMAAGTVLTAILACFVNAFVLLPAYGKAFGMPIETFIQMGSAVHSSVNGLLTFALLIIAPFNIFKYALTSLIVFVIYKKIRVVLKGD